MPAYGVKTNEGARRGVHAPGERLGTRAVAKHVRMSAYKARVVLDLIRGKEVAEADAILQFTEREAAEVIRKVLRSAVANAQNNEGIDPEVLYVSACFADEGMTIKRWRPRARGRATRIRKRTCHITIIVSAYTTEEQERRRTRDETRGGRAARTAAASRAARVAKSRQAAPAVGEPTADDAVAVEVDEELESVVEPELEAETDADADADAADEATEDEPETEPGERAGEEE
jgi:large subunit ribosomal protein L22